MKKWYFNFSEKHPRLMSWLSPFSFYLGHLLTLIGALLLILILRIWV